MILDFVDLKRRLDRHFRVLSREVMVKNMPMAARLPRTLQHEGHQTQQGEKRTDYEERSAQIQFSRDEVPGLTLAEVERRVIQAALDVAAEVERGLFSQLEDSARQAGTISEGRPLTPDAYLDALEKMDIDFPAGRERPRLPLMVAGPAGLARLEEGFRSMTDDERRAYDQREQQILDTKYAQYVSRENDRRLVE